MSPLLSENKIHIHCHIERTAGTSLIGEFQKIYGAKNVLLYKTQREELVRLSDIPISPASPVISWVKTTFGGTPVLKGLYTLYIKSTEWNIGFIKWVDPNRVPENTKVISGHFGPNKFSHIKNSFNSVVLRDPLERMVSQYFHWKRSGGPGWRLEYPYKDEGFAKYALWEGHNNFQTKTLDGWSLEDFDLVGVTKDLDIFIARLKDDEGALLKVRHANKTRRKPNFKKLGIDKAFIEKFKKLNEEDYKNYQLALKLAALSQD